MVRHGQALVVLTGGLVLTFVPLGELPSDGLLDEIAKFMTPTQLASMAPEKIIVPSAIREAMSTLISPSAAALSSAGVLPLMDQLVDTLEQVPLLIEEV